MDASMMGGGSMADLLNLAKNNNGNEGFGGGNGWWIILLLLYGRDGGLGNLRAGECIGSYTVTETDVATINRKLDNNGIATADAKCSIESAVAAEAQSILGAIHNNALIDAQTKADLISRIDQCCCNSQLEGMRNTERVTNAISLLSTKNDGQFNDLQRQNCDLKYTMATQHAEILNKLQVQNLEQENQRLRDQAFVASQNCQTDRIVAAVHAANAPTAPIAAYCVQPPLPVNTCGGGIFGGNPFASANRAAGIGNTSSSQYDVNIASGGGIAPGLSAPGNSGNVPAT